MSSLPDTDYTKLAEAEAAVWRDVPADLATWAMRAEATRIALLACDRERQEAEQRESQRMKDLALMRETAERFKAEAQHYRDALERAEKVIDHLMNEAVERWHDTPNNVDALHAWLGLTWEEYGGWVKDGPSSLVARDALAAGDKP